MTTNPVIALLEARLAGRSIATDPLPDGAVDELLEAARLAPSCHNKQPWRYLFLESDEARAKGAAALVEPNRVWAERAPLLVVAYTRREDDCVLDDGRAYHEFDLGLSVMNLMLAATHRGLLARPMAGFKPGKIRRAFELADDEAPLVALAVGLPSDDESHLPEQQRGAAARPRERKDADEIVRRL